MNREDLGQPPRLPYPLCENAIHLKLSAADSSGEGPISDGTVGVSTVAARPEHRYRQQKQGLLTDHAPSEEQGGARVPTWHLVRNTDTPPHSNSSRTGQHQNAGHHGHTVRIPNLGNSKSARAPHLCQGTHHPTAAPAISHTAMRRGVTQRVAHSDALRHSRISHARHLHPSMLAVPLRPTLTLGAATSWNSAGQRAHLS